MSKFGLVVLGAHIGVHIKSDIEKVTEGKILLVEPVPHNIKLIKQNLQGLENIIIEPVTISNVNQVRNFYFIKENSIGKLKKHWASGIGSFDKNHLLNHRSKRFLVEEEDIEAIQIQSLKFSDLILKHSIEEIDKLIIDVEGSEYEILKDLDLDKIKINSILFEFKHFDGNFKTGRKLEEILRKFELNNYKTSRIDEENILAIRH